MVFTVSNALKSQKKITINNLVPSTMYQIKIEAHNVAGSSKSEFAFLTLTSDGKRPSHNIVDNDLTKSYLYSNINAVIALGVTIILLFCICCSFGFGYRYSKYKVFQPLNQFLVYSQTSLILSFVVVLIRKTFIKRLRS